jgi:hypothetical protein
MQITPKNGISLERIQVPVVEQVKEDTMAAFKVKGNGLQECFQHLYSH